MSLPSEEQLYRAEGEPKSETEMFEVVLSMLQTCGDSLEPVALKEIAVRATEISGFSRVQLAQGQTWFAFQRNGLFVEHAGGVQDFTPKFRALLRLAPETRLTFEGISMRNNAGLIEIGGRVQYDKEIQKENGFTLLIAPPENGTIPPRTDLSVFR